MAEPTKIPDPNSSPRYRLTLIVFLTLLGIFIVINGWMIAPFLMATFMGAILAVLSRPLYLRLRDRQFGPTSASLVMVTAICLLIIVPFSLFAIQAIQQGVSFAQQLSHQGAFDLDHLIQKVSSLNIAQHFVESPEALEDQLKSKLSAAGAQVSGVLLAILGGLPDKILQIFLSLLSCFYFLIDGPAFLKWMNDKLPLDRDVRTHLFKAFRDTTIGTIWATLAASTVQTAIMFVAFLVLGTPGAFFAAGATFILTWIPLIGSTPVWVGGCIYLWANAMTTKAVLMLAFGLFCGVSDNFVRPWVLKGRSDMHPLVSLVSIFGGMQLFGLFGVFFGPILMAVFLSLLQVWPVVAKRFGLIPSRANFGILTPDQLTQGLTTANESPSPKSTTTGA